jgi:hypothetical protein
VFNRERYRVTTQTSLWTTSGLVSFSDPGFCVLHAKLFGIPAKLFTAEANASAAQ